MQIQDEQSPVENLGQVVFGERIRPSPYKVSTLNIFFQKFQDNEKL
jgi:hypothetical protein